MTASFDRRWGLRAVAVSYILTYKYPWFYNLGMNRKLGLFAIYGLMVFCFILTKLPCFVQNGVNWAFGTLLCIDKIRLDYRLGWMVLKAHSGRLAPRNGAASSERRSPSANSTRVQSLMVGS